MLAGHIPESELGGLVWGCVCDAVSICWRLCVIMYSKFIDEAALPS